MVAETDKLLSTAKQRSDSGSPSTTITHKKSASHLVIFMRKVYRKLGFKKGYNFSFFVFFGGFMLAFSVAQLNYLNIDGDAKSSFANSGPPGEWYWFHKDHLKIGISLHLWAILPVGILMSFQFVPLIRHKYPLVHRINGYVIMALVFISNIGALMITRRTFGGSLSTQSVLGLCAIITTVSLLLGWYNMRRLQIEQHRAWMIRAMFYLGTIISARIIIFISAFVITLTGGYYHLMSCAQIKFIYGPDSESIVNEMYPICASPNSSETFATVTARLDPNKKEQFSSSLNLGFGMGMWISLFLHAVGVEIYLALTPKETQLLRMVSYRLQLKAGFENPGSAGTVVENWGDADPWVPTKVVEKAN